jgi:hypothetical protein
MVKPLQVFIGHDNRENLAFWTCANSILRNTEEPISITPICSRQLPLTRPWDKMQSNDFAFTRWLVPYLSDYEGYSLFVDCDFIFRDDISKIFDLADDKALKVCYHPWEGEEGIKYLGTVQTKYSRKCWSSLMLFNNQKCKQLTLDYVNTAHGLNLHQFKWLKDEEIGEIPLRWNWLVDVYAPDNNNVSAVHYTKGGPYFKETANCGYNELWWDEYENTKYILNGVT